MRGSARLRRELVEHLDARGCLSDPAIRRAFVAVPRECFLSDVVERDGLQRVYRDEAIVTRFDARGVPASSSSQPSLMASMLERLQLRPGHRVLEIGTGTGYNAALLTRIVGAGGRVTSVELDPATARDARRALAQVGAAARVVRGDGRSGWPRGAPYDRIVVTAAAANVQRAWYDQLRDGGLLELPLVLDRARRGQMIVTLRKDAHALCTEGVLHGHFMALRDAPGAAVPSPPPSLSAVERIDDRSRSLAQLGGPALRRLSQARRRRLLALVLSAPRGRPLGLRAARPALSLYLMIEAPGDRLVSSWPTIGVISGDGEGLALLAGGPKTFTGIDTYGVGDAEQVLLALIEGWRQHGRPGADDLQVSVDFAQAGESAAGMSWGR